MFLKFPDIKLEVKSHFKHKIQFLFNISINFLIFEYFKELLNVKLTIQESIKSC